MKKDFDPFRHTDMTSVMPSTNGAFFLNGTDPAPAQWHPVWDNTNTMSKEFVQVWITRLKELYDEDRLSFDSYEYLTESGVYCSMGVALELSGIEDVALVGASTPDDFTTEFLKEVPRDLVSRIGNTLHKKVEKAGSLVDVLKILEAYAEGL